MYFLMKLACLVLGMADEMHPIAYREPPYGGVAVPPQPPPRGGGGGGSTPCDAHLLGV